MKSYEFSQVIVYKVKTASKEIIREISFKLVQSQIENISISFNK